MSRYRPLFEAMVADLHRNPNIAVVEKPVFGEPASADAIALASASAGCALPDEMEALYSEMNGFMVTWEISANELRQNDDRDTGRIRLLPISAEAEESVFNTEFWDDVIWFEGDDRFRLVRPLDFFVDEACAVLHPVPGDMTIHYHYCGEELHPTGYSFVQYIERLLASRGFWYWQQSLCVDLQDSAETERFRDVMPKLFRDYDDALFRPNTKEGELR